jgi:Xaa-Pro aminopeptidase
MPEIHYSRRERLAELVVAGAADAALITDLVNVRYLTGLASSNAALLVRSDGTGVLCTDGRYAGTAEVACPDVELVVDRATAAALVARAAGAGVRRLGFEAHAMAVEELRRVKDEDEIALLRRACEITDRAFADVLPMIAPGVTERDIAIALERRMVDLGAERPAFESIVASGPNGAIPHHRPGARAIEAGDLVTMDFGALCDGYHADMTRTVAVGRVADWQEDVYDLVATAQRAGLAAAVPGAEIKAVDAAARDIIEAAGHGGDYPHGLGHGVGLEIHESPLLGYDKTGKLDDRVPITAEPGVYLAGRGGVRIEDTLVVRMDGPELLTKTTKELLVL